MANKIKRFLSMALTVFMIMTMMPATVLATEGEQPIVVIETEPEVPANGDTPDAEIEGEEEPTEDGENSGDQHLCESYTEETLAAVDPTCTETGLTEGKKCSACGEVLVAQEVIEAAGHSYADGVCSVCSEPEVTSGQNPGAEVPGAGDEQPENNNVIVVTVNGTMTVGDSAPVYEEVITGELQNGHWVECVKTVKDADGNEITDFTQLAAGTYTIEVSSLRVKANIGVEIETTNRYNVQVENGVLTVKASEPAVEPTEEPVETPTPAPSAEPTPAPGEGDVVDPTPTEVPSATEAPAIPGGVQGDEGSGENPSADEPTTPVEVDSLDKLQAALADSNNLPILVTALIEIPENENIVLDLNGKTVNVGANYIENRGTLTIKNGALKADTFNNNTNGAPLWNHDGKLTVENDANITGVCAAIRVEGGSATINGGDMKAIGETGITSSIIRVKGSGSLTINGGTFEGCNSINPGEGCSILNVDTGTTTEINGGTFSDFAGQAIFGGNVMNPVEGVTVTGGKFNFDSTDGWKPEDCLADYLAEGYKVDAEGNVAMDVVAKIGENEYPSLAGAIEKAQVGDTIVLLANATGDVTVANGKNIILNLNGFDVVGEMNAITNSGTLVINDTVGTGNVYTTNVDAQGRAAIVNNGTITINGGWFGDSNNDTSDRNTFNRGNAIKNSGTAIINGGHFTNVSNQHISAEAYAYAINNLSGGSITINYATVYGDINGLIYADSKVVVKDGSFTLGRPNEENNLWYLAYGNVEIKGGTWIRAFVVPSWNTDDPTFNGDVSVSGGKFNVDIEEQYCAEGYIPIQNDDGTYGVEKFIAAMIGEKEFETVAAALTYAQKEGMSEVTITLMGEVTKEQAIALDDSFDLCYASAFSEVTFKQEDTTKSYHIAGIYTGSRTNGGSFVFDGVNIVVTDQYIFEGNVKLTNNSVIKSIAEANCFIYNGETTIEPGSKLYGVIEDFRGGDMIIDGGKTDGTYNTDPDMQDAIMVINWSGDKLVLKNGAYLKINSANEVGHLTLNSNTSIELNASKLDAWQWIKVDGTLKVDAKSAINTKQITGAGTIVIDATGKQAGDQVENIIGDVSDFTGELEVINNDNLMAEIQDDGNIYLVAKPVATVEDAEGNLILKDGQPYYYSLQDAFKAANAYSGSTITLLNDVTINEAWHCGNSGAKFTVPVTIDGDGHTLTFTGAVTDPNWKSIFRFEAGATVRNLTIDASEAEGIQRGITSKLSLTVENCTLIGNGPSAKRAIIFGEGAGNALSTVTATVIDCTFRNWSYGVSDNQNGKDAQSVSITRSEFENASVLISAHGEITFTGNTVENGYVNISSYTAGNACDVTATDNTLTVNPETNYNIISSVGGIVNAQDEFVVRAVAKIGTTYYGTLEKAIEKAASGDVIELLKDAELTDTLSIEKSITLNGNNYKIIPADDSKTYNSAIMAGSSLWNDDHGETITLNDIKFDGWKTNYGVVRAQGVTLNVDSCAFNGNYVRGNADSPAYGVLSLNFTDASVTNTSFVGNKDKAIDINYNGDGSNAVVTIDGCTFKDNESTGAGIVVRNDGEKLIVKNSTFTNNTVNTSGNAATLYAGWGSNDRITGCVFSGNSVTTSHATTNRFASAIFADGCTIENNAFLGNTATRNGESISTMVAVGAYYGAASVSKNYWNGGKPAYFVEYNYNEVEALNYYTGYSDGEFSGLTNMVAKGEKYSYATLEDALKADDGDTITLLADVTINGKLEAKASVELEQNGKKIVLTSDSASLKIETNNLNVTTNIAGRKVVYANGTYKIETDPRTVTFNANGGEGTMTAQTFLNGVSQALKANEFTRKNFYFTGWMDDAGNFYTNKQAVAFTKNTTLYAQWARVPSTTSYTVQYNANGGTGSVYLQAFTSSMTFQLRMNEFDREGYTFAGWNTKADGTGDAYAEGASFSGSIKKSIVLYAQWKLDVPEFPAVRPEYKIEVEGQEGKITRLNDTSIVYDKMYIRWSIGFETSNTTFAMIAMLNVDWVEGQEGIVGTFTIPVIETNGIISGVCYMVTTDDRANELTVGEAAANIYGILIK